MTTIKYPNGAIIQISGVEIHHNPELNRVRFVVDEDAGYVVSIPIVQGTEVIPSE